MEDIFITKIKINEVRHIKDFEINLSEKQRKHLIITGKNGSGKTFVLRKMKANLTGFFAYAPIEAEDDKMKMSVYFSNYSLARHSVDRQETIFASFEAVRKIRLNQPQGVGKIELPDKFHVSDKANLQFLQYIVNLKTQSYYSRIDNDVESAKDIDEWFTKFENCLKEIFDDKTLALKFDRENFNFEIAQHNQPVSYFNSLPAGFSAILDIVTEIMMRMEKKFTKVYDVQGVVLIDELETHLHVDLQKKILPFLTTFFPKIQFIVTTHSPFVINSVSNAVICDLEKRIVTEDLSGYSYDTLIESYFDSDKYSDLLKRKVERYEELLEQNGEGDKDELYEIKKYLNEIPKFVSDELAVKLQQLKLKEIAKKHK